MVDETKIVEIKNGTVAVKVNLARVGRHHHHRPHPHIVVDRDRMMVEKELHQIVEIDHHPETDSTTNDRIAEVVPIHGTIGAEVGAEIEIEEKAAVVVAAVVGTIHSAGRLINPPQMDPPLL